ncbi:Plasmid stabilization system protein ParE [Porphyromonadaceae bacterium NLAE-zl-C104]|jgi:plasmid stabilization system protein ParE|uniref:type II toxin-antitoxin system RelE/ParE family toxin n=1 Tax=Proteiniphilum TaxID=294702 RepID=UPI00089583AD|nr:MULTISPECIES: type II toxin-antitoxin system RelE/ParE family toxin [Proteiniphilum]MDY9918420.1 type II toxin-antitoxin system RelE/ParE family toxin [Proteiniphilum sp.]SDZ79567.1 Plasmid stabilization system protein ParE [Porphyromonadaceae bacterium KH3R12]SFS85337.1 Plasmid stabilization system protein ParE [Porphyromonadaceae bacterium NLAE-zl-C104]
MELEIFWSQFAEDKLQDIFDYYKDNIGIKVARKIVDKIVDSTINLDKNPRTGAIEQLLRDRKQEFRYLVSTNYKIIYYINLETKRIVIANVFDTRQNPDNMINEIEIK